MPALVRIRFSYFGWTAEFDARETAESELRARANALVLAEFGAAPALSYVEPGVPFPDFVRADVWDSGESAWVSYC